MRCAVLNPWLWLSRPIHTKDHCYDIFARTGRKFMCCIAFSHPWSINWRNFLLVDIISMVVVEFIFRNDFCVFLFTQTCSVFWKRRNPKCVCTLEIGMTLNAFRVLIKDVRTTANDRDCAQKGWEWLCKVRLRSASKTIWNVCMELTQGNQSSPMQRLHTDCSLQLMHH